MDERKLRELRRLADAATSGPYVQDSCEVYRPRPFMLKVCGTPRDHTNAPHDAAYLAAVDPTTILTLLDERAADKAEIGALRARVAELEVTEAERLAAKLEASMLATATQAMQQLRELAERAEATVERVREVAERWTRPTPWAARAQVDVARRCADELEAVLPPKP